MGPPTPELGAREAQQWPGGGGAPTHSEEEGGQEPSRGAASPLCFASQTGEPGLLPESSGRPWRAPSWAVRGGGKIR